jgi:hypothetical protein
VEDALPKGRRLSRCACTASTKTGSLPWVVNDFSGDELFPDGCLEPVKMYGMVNDSLVVATEDATNSTYRIDRKNALFLSV